MTPWLTRPAAFAAGLTAVGLLVLAGLGWATVTALGAETRERAATGRADRAARERLALWRLDGYLLPAVARENARPFAHYAAPSPLADDELPPWVGLHLQLDPANGWSAPLATERPELFALVTGLLEPAAAARLFAEPAPVPADPPPPQTASPPKPAAVANPGGPPPPPARAQQYAGRPRYPSNPPAADPADDQTLRQQAVQNNLSQSVPVPFTAPPQPAPAAKREDTSGSFWLDNGDPLPLPPGVHLGPVRPVWAAGPDGDWLFLVRTANVGGRRLYQAVWLDWPTLRAALIAQVADLFPAELCPVKSSVSGELALTVLPIRMMPAEPPAVAAGWTPLRSGLALAWAATLLGLIAAAAGGRAMVQLADRRGRFVAAVTHELRTPLTSLRLYLDLLAGGLVTDPQKQADYLSTLSGEADRLHRLIDNVLDFARLERRSVRANCRPVAVSDLLAELTNTWADRLAADGKELHVEVKTPESQQVRTDPRMAGQVLANLLDNARKYSRDAADRRVWVRAATAFGRLVIEVEDRGPGIPAADRRGLFRPFRRGRDTDAVAGGVGLGLALAAQWTRLLGGTLTHRPAAGGGACFRLELPGV